MNLLVVTQYYYPEQFRVNDICEEFAKRGHNVTVLTGLPNYPYGEIYDGYLDKAGTETVVNGVRIRRCRLFPRKKGLLNLIHNYVSFSFNGTKEIKQLKESFDVIFVYQMSPVTMAIPAIVLARKKRIPLVLYCLDLWPASILDHGVKRDGLLYLIVKKISSNIYKKCDKLIVSSPSFIRYISDLCQIDTGKMSFIPQHAEAVYDDFTSSKKSDVFHFVYLGNIGFAQNCECIVEAAKRISSSVRFNVHFVGSGSKLEELRGLVEKNGMGDYFYFHGFQKIDQIWRFYEIADACILTLSSETEIGLTIPAKLQGYMAAGKPVVAAISGDAKVIIEEAKCGYCVDSGDIEGLAASMAKMMENREVTCQMGINARDYYDKHFKKSVVLNQMEEVLNKVRMGEV